MTTYSSAIIVKRVIGWKFIMMLLSAFLLVSCMPPAARQLATRDARSEVEIYLQPVPAEAGRLRWGITSLAAVRSDGLQIPLTSIVHNFIGSDLQGKQTVLGSGFLPPGSYKGFSLTIDEAALARVDGEAALMVPDSPLFVAGPFDLAPSEVLPLFWTFEPEGFITGGFSFTPRFSMKLPSVGLTSLVGYVTVPGDDRITVFNRKTLMVTGAISTGRTPAGMVIDGARGRAYVAVSGEDAVQVIDVYNSRILDRIALRPGDEPVDLCLSDDGLTLITANYESGTMSVIDPIQAVEVQRIDVGRGPTSVTMNGKATRVYVTCSTSGSLSVVDLSSGTLSASMSLEQMTPLAAALDPGEDRLFIISNDSPELVVMDTETLAVTDSIYVGMGSASLAIDELSDLIFVGRGPGSEIAVVDPSVHLPIDFIRLKGAPGSMVIDAQEKSLLVTIPGKRIVQKINLVSRRAMGEMELDMVPSRVIVFE